MGLATYVGRAKLRSRWRSCLGAAVLLGLTAGLSMFALAGARRVQSSYPRFRQAGNPSTVSVSSFGDYDPDQTAAIARAPQVERSRTYVAFQIYQLGADGSP